tara:strand:+ start:1400 stop:1951 length:552 start_codon:yes stop_codon:yes gene_type:complete
MEDRMSEVSKEEVQENAQEVATDSQTQATEPSSEVGGLIAESKKYRSRAQDAEAKLAELEKQLAKQEEERMVKQNEWKELAEKRQSHIDSMEEDYKRLKNDEQAYKEQLLSEFDEEDKKEFENLSLNQIRTLHSKLIKNTSNVPPTDGTPARASNPTNKSWVDMSSEERRSNWGSIIGSYRKK